MQSCNGHSTIFSSGEESLPSWCSPICQCRLEVRETGSIPGSGRYPGGIHGNPLQYSCLRPPTMDRGAWWAAVHRVTQSQTRLKQYSTLACVGEERKKQLSMVIRLLSPFAVCERLRYTLLILTPSLGQRRFIQVGTAKIKRTVSAQTKLLLYMHSCSVI